MNEKGYEDRKFLQRNFNFEKKETNSAFYYSPAEIVTEPYPGQSQEEYEKVIWARHDVSSY